MLLHTYRNDEFQTRTTVHELNDAKGVYFRVVHVDSESGYVTGAVICATKDQAMYKASRIAAGNVLPGDWAQFSDENSLSSLA